MSNTVTVNKNVTNVVTVTAQGPQGIQGPSGSQGAGFNSSSYTTTSSFNTFTGSYQTDSSSFNNKITSLISATSSYVLNSQTASFATTGSNTFNGNQIITGSVDVTGSLNANAQVYEVSFLDKVASPYPSGSNIIELDQDLITNPNYTRSTNTITVSSSGLYRIDTQCYLQATLGITTIAEMAVFVNSSPIKSSYVQNIKNDTNPTYNITCVANLNANDSIEFYISSSLDFNLYALSPIYSVTCSYMTIEKLN